MEALFRVAVRSGIAGASYRAIATEAGIPTPQVQYYFPTRSALLEGALNELGLRIVGRGMKLIQEGGPDPSPEHILRSAVAGAMPVDDETRQDIVLFYLFYVAMLSDESPATGALTGAQGLIVTNFADAIRRAQERGEVSPDADPEHEARLVLFANTGLVLGALVGIHTVDDAAATMDYLLTKLFNP